MSQLPPIFRKQNVARTQKPLLFPFHPFRTLKELFGEEKLYLPNPAPVEKPPP